MSSRDIEVTVRRQLAVTQPLQFTRSVAGRLQPNTELITCAVTRVESDSQTGATDKNCLEFGLSQLHCKSEPWPAALQPQLQPSISTRRRPAWWCSAWWWTLSSRRWNWKLQFRAAESRKVWPIFPLAALCFLVVNLLLRCRSSVAFFWTFQLRSQYKHTGVHWSTREKWVNNKPTECPSPTAPQIVVCTRPLWLVWSSADWIIKCVVRHLGAPGELY